MSSKKRKKHVYRLDLKLVVPGCLLTVLAFLILGQTPLFQEKNVRIRTDEVMGKAEIKEEYLTPNSYSRPGIELKQVNGIVIHYVGNAGSSAEENRDYFESLKENHERKASSHFIVGLEGEIIQCIPLNEIAYASNQRNKDTISIETCHPKKDGKFNKKTYESLVQLTGELCLRYNLTYKDVIRHYDVTGKQCPLYFVENEAAWEQFRMDVEEYRKGREE